MATVSVQPKGKCWYTVISYKDEHGKWKNKMQTTGLPIKGNKKRAEKIAAERLAAFEEPEQVDESDPFILLNFLEKSGKFFILQKRENWERTRRDFGGCRW